MSELDSRLDREEIVEQAVRAVQTGRLAVLIAEQPVFTGLLGDAAVMLMDSGADVARLDAFDAHSSDAVRDMLCRALDLDESVLIDGLRFRGETGNPFCLVIDSGECLDRKAFILLKTLLEQTAGGLGVLLAGEPDLEAFVDEFGMAVSWRYELEPDYPLASEEVEGSGSGLALPWKHLAAAAGLALLAVLFWPGDDSREAAEVRTLALPERPTEAPPMASADPVERSPETAQHLARPLDAGSKQEPGGEPAATVAPDPAPVPAAEVQRPAVQPEQTAKSARSQPDDVNAEPVAAAPVVAESPTAPEPTSGGEAETQKDFAPPPSEPAPVVTRDPALSGLDAELNYRQEDWLLALEGTEWLLQVALATTEDGARSLLDRLGRQRAAYYRAQRSGRSVYIVLAGPWPDRKSAVDARATLPEDLRSLGPFPRQAETVQQELAAGYQ